MYKPILSILIFAFSYLSLPANAEDVIWNSYSENSAGSMPCGGGDIGLNVWVENGELMFYISRSGTYDEHNTLLKLGRVRVKLDKQDNSQFSQALKLNDGYVEVALGDVTFDIWADVYHPVIHVEANSKKAFEYDIAYENWRYVDRPLRKGEGRQNSLKWSKFDNLCTSRDSVWNDNSSVTFYHLNPAETVFDTTVSIEGLDEVKDRLWNPISNLAFGGKLSGNNLAFEGASGGEYIGTDYKAWNFKSSRPAKSQSFEITLHTEQTSDLEAWQQGLQAAQSEVNTKKDRQASRQWWNDYWQRSYIHAEGEAQEMARNYTLFRYMLGCNAYGSEPTKFNGGLFTFDPVLVDTTSVYTPDYRNWGGGTMTAQNQRLVYWPMLKSGDYDMMKAQFDFYNRMLSNAEIRSEHYWNHAGACFSEQIENFGLPNFVEYGTKRPDWFDKGLEYNAWLEYEWDTVLEFCQMILESNSYGGVDVSEYMPLVESCLTFFDEHYQYLASKRGRKKLDGDGKLILFPGSGCETYKMTNNSASTVAALQTVLKTYIDLKGDSVDAKWTEMLTRIPDIPLRVIDNKITIAPAKSWERVNNVESPQLYPVFPWRMYGIANADSVALSHAVNTYFLDPDVLKFRSTLGWKQDNIWAACLGLTDEAVRLNSEKMRSGPFRFPAFWEQGYDWAPDHNKGGASMIGLQEMLMQSSGSKIMLFPAWPQDWDVNFKLHAPEQTVIEAKLENGKIVNLKVIPESRRDDIIINPSYID